ncbi:hypothetical protein NDU88_000835 [Pleurodeles waltl]|uniref:Uncharacterized protein n=1 Tax=Pleurodeles waltl TaxID=8319 RepID=A0AAV7WKL1_PLEWA|nr:hypothetical protein NDU88_000835 [Pleurodeles waltl]
MSWGIGRFVHWVERRSQPPLLKRTPPVLFRTRGRGAAHLVRPLAVGVGKGNDSRFKWQVFTVPVLDASCGSVKPWGRLKAEIQPGARSLSVRRPFTPAPRLHPSHS